MVEDILDVASPPQFDDSIVKMTFHSYHPHNTLTLNNSDEIRIAINNQDLLTLPSRSYLYIRGKLTNHDKGHLVNNAFAFMFDEILYMIAGKEIDMVRNPGITSLMKLVCSMKKNLKLTNAALDTDDNLKAIHNGGEFSGCIPMEMLMGVFEDYNKVLVNVKQELVLKRSKNDLNCIFTTAAKPGAASGDPDLIPSITIDSIQWIMPHVIPSDAEKLTLNKVMMNNQNLQIAFRSFELNEYPGFPKAKKTIWPVKVTNQLESPRYIILGFQTARDGKERARTDRFDHCKLKNLRVFLNSEYYPYQDLNLDFPNKDVSKAYEMFIRFRESYYNTEPDPAIIRSEFISQYPLIVVDCSKQNESIKEGVVDIKLEIELAENAPEGTVAYCLIIHDKLFQYNPLTNEINKM